MTPTPAQIEACRMALGFGHNANGAKAWLHFTDDERQQIVEVWLLMQLPRPPATKQEVDELYG